MQIRRFARALGVAAAVLAASLLIVPSALARVHVGVGISIPGISVGVGNCWRCGYVPAPAYYPPAYYAAPAYYGPAYYGPAYYRAPAYYAPRPVYYGYGYYRPYYPRYHHRGYDRGHGYHRHGRSGYYRHGHR